MSTTPTQNAAEIVENEPFIDTRNATREAVTLSEDTVDAGNSPTTQLRRGLVLGYDGGLDLWIDAGDATVDAHEQAVVTSVEAPDADWQSMVLTVTIDGVDYEVTAGGGDDTIGEFVTLINDSPVLAPHVIASDSGGDDFLVITSRKSGVRMTVTADLASAFGAAGLTDTAEYTKFGILADPVASMLGIDGAVEKKRATVITANAVVRGSRLFQMTGAAREFLRNRGILFEDES